MDKDKSLRPVKNAEISLFASSQQVVPVLFQLGCVRLLKRSKDFQKS